MLALAGACNEDPEGRAMGYTSATTATAGDSDTDGETSGTDGESDSDDASSGGDTLDSDGKTGGSESGEPVDDSGNDEGGEQCEQAQYSFTFTPETPNVMLVLDKSRSMSNLWDHDLNPGTATISRYHSLHNVVRSLVNTFSDDINFGAQLFPSADAYLDEPTNDFSCLVEGTPEVALGHNTATDITAVMPPADDFTFSGGTPAVAGLSSAIDHLIDEAPADSNRAVIFITDGAANCSPDELPGDTLFVYDAEVPTLIEQTYNDEGIPVYVVGINILDEMGTKPAVNPFEAITDAAMVGGAPAPGGTPFYNAFNELELIDALEQVVEDIECTVNLDVEPIYPDSVGVAVDLEDYSQVDDCETQDGWTYPSEMGPYNSILLCGSACDAIQNGGVVDVEYICPG
jgi:hypothetical protein